MYGIMSEVGLFLCCWYFRRSTQSLFL